MEALVPWARRARVCELGGYVALGPENGSPPELVVTRPGLIVWVKAERDIDVVSGKDVLVSARESGTPGAVAFLSYTIVDSSTGLKYSVTDVDGDGTLDTKIGESDGFVNIAGSWARLERRGTQRGAIVGGHWEPITQVNGKWVLGKKSDAPPN